MSTVSEIVNGNVISFRSKAVNDNNFYYGRVIGIVTSEIAKSYVDIYTWNSSVQSADSTVPAVDLQTFLLIQLLEKIDDTTKYIIPFSKDWINEASLSIIATDRTALIKVYDVDSANVQDVLNVLATAGFRAKVESLT